MRRPSQTSSQTDNSTSHLLILLKFVRTKNNKSSFNMTRDDKTIFWEFVCDFDVWSITPAGHAMSELNKTIHTSRVFFRETAVGRRPNEELHHSVRTPTCDALRFVLHTTTRCYPASLYSFDWSHLLNTIHTRNALMKFHFIRMQIREIWRVTCCLFGWRAVM